MAVAHYGNCQGPLACFLLVSWWWYRLRGGAGQKNACGGQMHAGSGSLGQMGSGAHVPAGIWAVGHVPAGKLELPPPPLPRTGSAAHRLLHSDSMPTSLCAERSGQCICLG